MRGTVAKRLRKLAKHMAQYKVDHDQLKDGEYQEIAEKRAYKLLKKGWKAQNKFTPAG